MMQPKTPKDSLTIMTDLVLPGETNPLNNLFGGELLARMDRAASITARRHSRRICVTASVNSVAFNKSIPLGSVVTIEAKVSRTFRTSMEIFLRSEEHTSELQSRPHLVCRLLLEKKKTTPITLP